MYVIEIHWIGKKLLCSLYTIFSKSLILHEENSKEINI